MSVVKLTDAFFALFAGKREPRLRRNPFPMLYNEWESYRVLETATRHTSLLIEEWQCFFLQTLTLTVIIVVKFV